MTETSSTQPTTGPPLSTVHDVLKNRRRRFVVDVLAGRQAPIELTVLARAIALRLPGGAKVETGQRVAEIRTVLHHVDLPKLADADALEYDHEEAVVVPGDLEQFTRFLDENASLQ